MVWQLMEKLQKFFDSSAPKTFEPKKAAAAAESTPDDSTSSGAGGRAQRLLDAHVEKQGTRRQRAAAARQRERSEQEQDARGSNARAGAVRAHLHAQHARWSLLAVGDHLGLLSVKLATAFPQAVVTTVSGWRATTTRRPSRAGAARSSLLA